MTRGAVENGFRRFVDRVIDATMREFDVVRAVADGTPGPNPPVPVRVLRSDGIVRRLVEPELATYREAAVEQFDVVLDYATADRGIDAYADEVLANDAYYQSLRSDLPDGRRAAIRDRLLRRNARLGDAVVPLVESPEGAFWDATRDALDREEATDLVETHFAFTDPVREHPDAFVFHTEVDVAAVVGGVGGGVGGGLGRVFGGGLPTLRVEYTDEAIRAMRHAEETVTRRAKREARQRFDDAG